MTTRTTPPNPNPLLMANAGLFAIYRRSTELQRHSHMRRFSKASWSGFASSIQTQDASMTS